MRYIRRTFAALAAPALVLGLSACSGGGGEEGPTDAAPSSSSVAEEPTEEPSDQPTEDSSDEPTEEPTSDSTTEEPTEDGTASEDDSDSDTSGGTTVQGLWVDDSWTIEERDDDVCAFAIDASIFSESDEVFSCGANADSAIACALEEGEQVLCITNVRDRVAVRFPSPTATSTELPIARSQDPTPIEVVLPDDVSCTTTMHDNANGQPEGMFSWYECEDGSLLLSSTDIAGTFDRDDLWTTQRSHDGADPEATAVRVASFADPAA